MQENNIDQVSVAETGSDALSRSARDMVGSIDQILDNMVATAPSEGSGWEIPLTLREVWLVKTIAPRGSMTMSALAASMGVSLPTATHLVDRLVAKGVVVRIRPEHDRRLVLIALSERSKTHLRVYFENRVAFIRRVLEPLAPAERDDAVKVLGQIAQLVASHPAIQAGQDGTQ